VLKAVWKNQAGQLRLAKKERNNLKEVKNTIYQTHPGVRRNLGTRGGKFTLMRERKRANVGKSAVNDRLFGEKVGKETVRAAREGHAHACTTYDRRTRAASVR